MIIYSLNNVNKINVNMYNTRKYFFCSRSFKAAPGFILPHEAFSLRLCYTHIYMYIGMFECIFLKALPRLTMDAHSSQV